MEMQAQSINYNKAKVIGTVSRAVLIGVVVPIVPIFLAVYSLFKPLRLKNIMDE
jgi:hypothetical protein